MHYTASGTPVADGLIKLYESFEDAEYTAKLASLMCKQLDDKVEECWIGMGYSTGDVVRSETFYLYDGHFIKQWYDDRFEYVRVPKTMKGLEQYHKYFFNLGELLAELNLAAPQNMEAV